MSSKKKYSLYELVDPRNGEPFYIGITTNPKQRQRDHCATHKKEMKDNPLKTQRVVEIKSAKLKPAIRVLVEDLDYEDACKLEVKTIKEKRLQGYDITNISPGGNTISEETKKRFSDSHKGYKKSPEYIANWVKSRKGKKYNTKKVIANRAYEQILMNPFFIPIF